MNLLNTNNLKAAYEKTAAIDSSEIKYDELKGDVDIKWYGFCGFKIHFLDKQREHRNIYVDIFIDAPECPAEDKKECPNDCDIALVTKGQPEASMHSPLLISGGKKQNRTICCSEEVGLFLCTYRNLENKRITKMQHGGSKDFGFAKITMVFADHSSTSTGPNGVQITGGLACGYIIEIPNHNYTVYFAGATGMFSDMLLLDKLYKPDIAFIPVGNILVMGPREAAHSVVSYLPSPEVIIPIYFSHFKELTGTVAEFKKECKKMGMKHKMIVHPEEFLGGKAIKGDKTEF